MVAVRHLRFVLLAAALAAPLLAGCNPASKLVGKWQLEADKVQANLPAIGGDNPMVAAMASQMMSMMKFDIELEFQGDGTCQFAASVLGQSHRTSGKWRYLKTEGDVLVLMVTTAEQPGEREVRLKFVDDDHLETIPPMEAAAASGPKTLPFKRVKT
jgi:hypothetical protein